MARHTPAPPPALDPARAPAAAADFVRTAALVGTGTALTVGAYLETVALLVHFA